MYYLFEAIHIGRTSFQMQAIFNTRHHFEILVGWDATLF